MLTVKALVPDVISSDNDVLISKWLISSEADFNIFVYTLSWKKSGSPWIRLLFDPLWYFLLSTWKINLNIPINN